MSEREPLSAEEREDMRLSIESLAARRAYDAEMGASEWEAFLTPMERAFLDVLTRLAAEHVARVKAEEALRDADDLLAGLGMARDVLAPEAPDA